MREKKFKKFAKTAHLLPIGQKRRLLAQLKDEQDDDLTNVESFTEHHHFSLFGNHTLAGLHRLY